MQKVLVQMNVYLHLAVADIAGVTGMRILRAIAQGQHDPQTLAALRDPNCKKTRAEIAKALGCQRSFVSQVLQREMHFSFEQAEQLPVRTVLSGPSTGVVGAREIGRLSGLMTKLDWPPCYR